MAHAITRRISDIALPVCLAAMDGCWLYVVGGLVWSSALAGVIGPLSIPSPLLLWGLGMGAFWLVSRLLDSGRLSTSRAQGFSGSVGLATAIAVSLLINGLPGTLTVGWAITSVYVAILSLVPWFIGGYRASEVPDFNHAYATFRNGLIAMAVPTIFTILILGSSAGPLWGRVGSTALWFLIWSLAALALGNREVVREEAGDPGAGSWASWGPALTLSIAFIVIVGLVGGATGGRELLFALRVMLGWVIFLGGTAIYYVLYGILWLISLLGIELVPLSALRPPPRPQESENGQEQGLEWEFGSLFGISPEIWTLIWNALLVIGLLIVLVVVIWLVSRGVRSGKQRKTRLGMVTEERERLGGWVLLVQQLRAWLALLLARFRRKSAVAELIEEDDLRRLHGKPELSGTLTVRQIYARLLGLAATAGFPRARHQTPIEYLAVLSGAVPQLRPELAQITSAYLEARYGPMPTSGPAVLAANNAWKRAELVLMEWSVVSSR